MNWAIQPSAKEILDNAAKNECEQSHIPEFLSDK